MMLLPYRRYRGGFHEEPLAAGYQSRHALGAASTVRWALNKLIDLDYVEKKDKTHTVVDPLVALWVEETQAV